MAKKNHLYVILLLTTFLSAGCISTRHYHVQNTSSSGFSKLQVGKDTYQVRFESINTSKTKVAQFLLRRCAQITLEHQKRFFSLSNSESEIDSNSTSTEQTIMKILNSNEDSSSALVLDAVTIVNQTNKMADGKLSKKARETLNRLENSGK